MNGRRKSGAWLSLIRESIISVSPLLFLILFLLTSCSPKIIPDEIDAKIDKTLSYKEIEKNPEKYLGKRVLLGGEIIETHVTQGGSEIEILQKPLNSGRAPRFTDESLGRFFISATTFLDPVIYKSGRRITVVGIVKGSKTRQIGDAKRIYPLLGKEYLHLWAPGSRSPEDGNPRISIGFGAIFHD